MPNYAAFAFLAAGLVAVLFTFTHQDTTAMETCRASHSYAACYNTLNR